jgi:hypothetical protein
MKTVEGLIKEFLEGLREINSAQDQMSAARLFSLKADLETQLKRVTKVTDLQLVIEIDDLDEFDGENVA